MKKGLKIFLIILGIIIILAAVLLAGAYSMFKEQLTAVNTIKKLDENLYCMEYVGDYGLDEFIARGGAADSGELSDYLTEFLSHGFYHSNNAGTDITYGCSTISAKTSDGTAVFGRNYDWESCMAIIIHTKPSNGYESVSTACLDFLGFGEDYKPESMANKMLALAAVYIPLDGINEKGLVIADLMAGDKDETHQDTDKPDITTTTMIRLILDRAATVDEAVELIKQYDMNSDIGSAHHYSIADASGKAVVVEYIDGEMVVTETKVVTNHYLSDCDKAGTGSEQSHDRFDKLTAILDDTNGVMARENVRDALQSVSQGNYGDEYEITCWSIVYSKENNIYSADFYWNENYDTCYSINLNGQGNWIFE